MSDLEHIEIPVIVDGQPKGVGELVEVERLGDNLYKLVCPPAMVEGLAIGDTFELDEDDPAGFQVVEHSGYLTIWMQLPDRELTDDDFDLIQDALNEADGIFHGIAHGIFAVFSAPVSAGMDEVSSAMDNLVATMPGASWQYANVYDWDGEPLGWWN